MAGVQAIAGLGRGAKLTTQGKIRDCAKAVIFWRDEWERRGAVNGLYNMAYFGKAMRDHLAYAIKEGEAYGSSEVSRLVVMANSILEKHCDGKDCSFVS